MDHQDTPDAQFWQDLATNCELDGELIAEFLAEPNAYPRRLLGEILLREKCLTMGQVYVLVGIQADEPNIRFGELAVREGFCTAEDVERALAIQETAGPSPISEILHAHESDEVRVVDELVGYLHHLEGRVRSLAG